MKCFAIMLLLCRSLFAGEIVEAVRFRYERFDVGLKAVVTGHGTAFCVSVQCGKGYPMLTAAHLVVDDSSHKPYKKLMAESNGKWIDVEIISFDTKKDIALVVTHEPVEARTQKLAMSSAKLGDKLKMFGSKRSEAVTENEAELVEKWDNGELFDRMKVKFDHGDSGGPVTWEGLLIGIVTNGLPLKGNMDPNQGRFLPLSLIREFLEDTAKDRL